jgi:predicted metal-binding membrane protein
MGATGHEIERPTPRPLRLAAPSWALLAVAGGLGWAVTVGQARAMGVGPGTMDMAFPFFVGMWVAMMGAMMLPALGPVAEGHSLLAGNRQLSTRLPGALAFGGGFLLPWAAYGTVAFAVLLGTGRLVEVSPEAARWLGVGIFAVAGIYQLTPWKLRAVEHCRTAMSSSHRTGPPGRLSEGIRDGAVCVCCCWALMTILIAVGVMNLWAMVGLAAVIFAEKVLPKPRLIVRLAGVALLALAVLAALDASVLAGLTVSGMSMQGQMQMGGM